MKKCGNRGGVMLRIILIGNNDVDEDGGSDYDGEDDDDAAQKGQRIKKGMKDYSD
jgi:hypothetical protein